MLSDIPNWLGGSLPVLNKSDEIPKTTHNISEKVQITTKINEEKPVFANLTEVPDQLQPQNIAMEIQNTYSSLHQQESVLLFSLQLKKYEETLNEIKDQQNAIMHKQQDQMKSLMDEYIFKQQMAENNIRLQQERINNQIKLIVNSSIGSKSHMKGEGDNSNPMIPEDFQNLIHTLKQRHNEELFILEESYKYVAPFLNSFI